jgi:hypothetical protein
MMVTKIASGLGAEVKVLRVVLFMLMAVYWLVVVLSLLFVAKVFPLILEHPSGTSFLNLMGMVRVLFDRVLPGVVYFFIGWGIYRLIALVSHGEPFSSASPRYIRKIGFAVLGLAVVNAVVDALAWLGWRMDFLSRGFVWALCNLLSTALLGFGFLVIARVLEVGVRLQQDQNLTV